ncbi:MAG: collagen-like protein [Chitinophagales bacterium]|nr:collagen-like protein [Chitinophagales bacterium]
MYLSNGNAISLTSIQDGTGTDDQNLTSASLSGTTLTIDIENGNSVSVDLGSLAVGLDSIYGQGDSLVLVSNGGLDTAYVNLGASTDTDDQTLSLSNDTLYISEGNFVVLSDNVNDADADPTNELQTLSFDTDSLYLSNGGSIAINDLAILGPQGPVGPQGPAGLDGADGAQGPAGPQGPAGLDGADGAQGPAGPQGPAGLDGEMATRSSRNADCN